MPTFRNFDVYLHAKNELHSYFFFEILQRFANLLLWVLSESLIMFINNEVSPFIKIWCPKCWNKLVGHFVHLHAKNQLRHSLLFKDTPEKQQNFYFRYFGNASLYTTKMIASTCRRLQRLSACQKFKFIIYFF